MGFSGRTVVVTGGASGIGLAMAEGFHAEGARVVAADTNEERLDELRRRFDDIAIVAADISSPEGAQRIIDAAGDRLDVLCNNAGVSDGSTQLDEMTMDVWNRCLAINLTGTFLVSQAAVKVMVAAGGGTIVNTASVAGLRGGRGGAAYTASKFGVVGLTQNIAARYGRDGIRCNAICPGPVSTNLQFLAPRSAIGLQRVRSDPSRPKAATPEQVAAVALMLARDEIGLVNGAAIPVDDGWLAY